MYKHILVPTDGSELSLKAVTTATRLAHGMNARITALHVIEPYKAPLPEESISAFRPMMSPGDYLKAAETRAGELLGKVKAAAAAEDVECDTLCATEDRPWEAIIGAARSRNCDLIVMASHGRKGLAGLLLGSETHKVLTHTSTPVLVCR